MGPSETTTGTDIEILVATTIAMRPGERGRDFVDGDVQRRGGG